MEGSRCRGRGRRTEAAGPSHNIRPGRRRKIRHALASSHIFFFAIITLVAICPTAESRSLLQHKVAPSSRSAVGAAAPQVFVANAHILPRQDLINSSNGDGNASPAPEETAAPPAGNPEEENDDDSASTTSADPTNTSSAPSRTASVETDSESAGPTETAWPSVFDSNMGNNFTSASCPDFINRFRVEDDFTGCLPLSMLLQNSRSFFMQSKTNAGLRRILDRSCDVVFEHCRDVMSGYAAAIRDDSNCGQDYLLGNPLVVAAYIGFQAYEPLHHAGCLRDSAVAEGDSEGSDSTSSNSSNSTDDDQGPTDGQPEYCFISSIADDAPPADNYIYSLALGIPLPGASRPTCSACLQQTMEFFATAAQNMSNPLSTNYPAAALQINNGCGPNWVQASVDPIEGSGEDEDAANLLVRPGRVLSLAALAGFLLF